MLWLIAACVCISEDVCVCDQISLAHLHKHHSGKLRFEAGSWEGLKFSTWAQDPRYPEVRRLSSRSWHGFMWVVVKIMVPFWVP